MVWFKVDDQFNSHPKVLAAGVAAVGLWTLAGSWSSANLTNGFVPDPLLPRLDADGPSHAETLATVGLWRRTRGGYQFHDWEDYNPDSETVLRKRDEASKRMRELRAKRATKPIIAGDDGNGSCEQPANVPRTPAERSRDVRNPDPDPVPKGSSDEEPSPPPKRTAPKTTSADPQFEEFYAAYPKHVGRRAAETAWRKVIRGADPELVIAGARRYATERQSENPQYTKHPATWLNQGCWTDDPQVPRHSGQQHLGFQNPDPDDYFEDL